MAAEHAAATAGPHVFVTVGSTQFVALVGAMLSTAVVDALADACAPRTATLTIQYGATPLADILTSPTSALSPRGEGLTTSDPLGATGTLNVPMSALMPGRNDDEEDVGTLAAKTFKLRQRNVHDHEHDDEDDDAAEEEAHQRIPHQRRKQQQHVTFDVQAGTPNEAGQRSRVVVELMDYVDSITPFLRSSQVVISHAGSGTILEALRVEPADKRPKLVVVPNETLMDNHQTELALALANDKYVVATRIQSVDAQNRLPLLLKALLSPGAKNAPELAPFPPFLPARFREFVDGEMGFAV